MKLRSLAWLLAVSLCSPLACRTTSEKVVAEPQPDVQVANRDPHAEPDVAKYIAKLESAERVADLQVDKVVEKLALPADATIGDLGCGPGIFAFAFAKACPRGIVYASDIEPGQLDRVREGIAKTGVRNIVPVLASYEDPHFPPGRIDVVFIGDTYHHLQDRVAYMQRLKSVLKSDARVVVFEYKPGTLPVGPPAEHKLPAGVMARELVEAGYTEVQRFDTHMYHDFVVYRVLQPHEMRR
jgi:ubiquinone/menaquinone biosynthesis C-methylase UbiE